MNLQFVQKIIKNVGVSPTIIKRGLEIYKNNEIKELKYEYTVDDEENQIIIINALVKGSKLYEVNLELFYDEDEDIDFEDQFNLISEECNCPYADSYYGNWDTCKHRAAVLIKFFMDKGDKISSEINSSFEERKKFNEYVVFKTWINCLGFTNNKVKINYRVKGFDNKTINFKIFFDIVGIAPDEQERFFENIFYYGPEYIELLNYVSEEDYQFLKSLRNLNPKKNSKEFSIFISKNKENIVLLKEAIFKNKIFTEKNQKISYGGLIKPEIYIDGTEKEVEIKAIRNYTKNLYRGEYISWVFEDNTFYDYDNGIEEMAKEISIPDEYVGEFLFDDLKLMKKNYNAELSPYFENLKLITIEPKVKISLDYKNEKVFFNINLNIHNKNYKNLDMNKPELKELHDTYKKESENTWSKISMEQLFILFDFTNKFKHEFNNISFVITNKLEIQKFLTEGVPHIPEDWEVEKSESFENIKVEEIELEPIVEFLEKGNNIDWFEFTVKYLIDGITYTRKELQKLIEYNEDGEAFIKIGSKYFLLKETENENKIKNLVSSADEDKKGNFKSSYFNMIYYRELMNNSGINFKGNKVYDELHMEISNMSILENLELPEEVEGILRPYQKEGYKWLKFLNKFRFGGILADDMGLGKTLQTLSFLKHIDRILPSIIVVPKSLIYNWKNEAEKFFPTLKVCTYDGSVEKRKKQLEEFGDFDLIITSFDVASRDCDELQKVKFLYLVLDEAHNIKNRTTKRTTNIKKIKSQYRLALTGTPLENSLEELWSIFDFVIPGYLGSFKQFNENYVKNEENREQKIYELKNKITPFMLRRKKEDVLKELPDKIENIVSVEMNEEQNIAYNIILDKVKADLESLVADKGFNSSQIGILAALTKLRQICNHPNLVFEDSNKAYESAKLETLVELVKESIYAGHKILVFSQFVQMLKLIKEKLDSEEINYEYLDGSTKNRMEVVNKFNESEDKKVFLLSLKAGGTGLNLTSADIVIHVDPWWNPQIERQATDRAHRMGQNKKVMVYKLITKGTVEEKMLKLQDRKKEVFDAVIDSNSGSLSKVTWNDIQELLSVK